MKDSKGAAKGGSRQVANPKTSQKMTTKSVQNVKGKAIK